MPDTCIEIRLIAGRPVWELPGGGFDPLVHVFNPPPLLSSVLTLGGSGSPNPFSLIPTLR